MADAKRVFVSYSHDSPEHKAWVAELSTYLAQNGLDVILDQWDLDYGWDLPSFMESVITGSDRVLIILTDGYIAKAHAGKGGVGYERTIVTAEIFRGVPREKFIPVLRDVTGEQKLPTFLASARWIDLTNGDDRAAERAELVRCLHGIAPARPAIGRSPFADDRAIADPAGPDKPARDAAADDSLAIFADRFRKAFTGLRGSWWFSSHGNDRELLAFMKEPLRVGDLTPFWWWRGESEAISRFEPVVRAKGQHWDPFSREADKILMNNKEFILDYWAACHMGDPARHFIYVATKACSPIGGGYTTDDLIHGHERGHYIEQEFGLVDNRDKITKAAYEDRAEDDENAELRSHFITRYNFLIIPQGSDIRRQSHSGEIEKAMAGMLSKKLGLKDLRAAIAALSRDR